MNDVPARPQKVRYQAWDGISQDSIHLEPTQMSGCEGDAAPLDSIYEENVFTIHDSQVQYKEASQANSVDTNSNVAQSPAPHQNLGVLSSVPVSSPPVVRDSPSDPTPDALGDEVPQKQGTAKRLSDIGELQSSMEPPSQGYFLEETQVDHDIELYHASLSMDESEQGKSKMSGCGHNY